jgi:hypothetical protein
MRIVALSHRNLKSSSCHQSPWTRRLHHWRWSDKAPHRRWHTAASDQLSKSWALIWWWHDACPVQYSESIGMSHNHLWTHQQGLEWFNIASHKQAVEAWLQCWVLSSWWAYLCDGCPQWMSDRQSTKHVVQTPVYSSYFLPWSRI